MSQTSPARIAGELGLTWTKPGRGSSYLTSDDLLDLAVKAYWRNRAAVVTRKKGA